MPRLSGQCSRKRGSPERADARGEIPVETGRRVRRYERARSSESRTNSEIRQKLLGRPVAKNAAS